MQIISAIFQREVITAAFGKLKIAPNCPIFRFSYLGGFELCEGWGHQNIMEKYMETLVQGIDEGLQFLLFFLGQGLKLRPGHHGLSLLRRRYRHHLLLLTFAAAWAGALLRG